MQRLMLFLPVIIFVILAVLLLYVTDFKDENDSNQLINLPIPEFQIQQLENPEKTLTRKDIVGQVALLNVWGTWCPNCRIEHPYLMDISENHNIPIYGLNYKDQRDAAINWLAKYGNPYKNNLFDDAGSLAIDLGVTGAPETYVVDKQGNIRYKYLGIVNTAVWENKLKPVIDRLMSE